VLDQIANGNSGFVTDFQGNVPGNTAEDRQYIMGYYVLDRLPALHELGHLRNSMFQLWLQEKSIDKAQANYKIACLCKLFRLSDYLTCLTADSDLMQDSREWKRQTARQDMFRVDLMTSSLASSVGF